MYPNTSGARFDHAYYRDKHKRLFRLKGIAWVVPYLRGYASPRD